MRISTSDLVHLPDISKVPEKCRCIFDTSDVNARRAVIISAYQKFRDRTRTQEIIDHAEDGKPILPCSGHCAGKIGCLVLNEGIDLLSLLDIVWKHNSDSE